MKTPQLTDTVFLLVGLHTAMVVLHACVYEVLPVAHAIGQVIGLWGSIIAMPVLATLAFWFHGYRQGAALQVGAMVGAQALLMYYHFVLIGPERMAQIPIGGCGMLFQATAVALAAIEGWILGVSLWMLRGQSAQRTK